MTTPLKARLYRLTRAESPVSRLVLSDTKPAAPGPEQIQVTVRRGGAAPATTAPARAPAADPDADLPFAGGARDDGFGTLRLGDPPAAPATAEPASAQTADTALAAVRAENLTARQLRMAGRIAAMHGLTVESDEDAVIQLRARGIDPFQRETVGRVLSTQASKAQAAPPATPPARRDPRLPVTAPPPPGGPVGPARAPGTPALPSREEMTEQRRAAEILRIQQDIARRRARKLTLLALRLFLLVGIPTMVIGWYYARVATPLYDTPSQFLIQQADATASGHSALGGMGALQSNTDSVSVQGYLTSRDAMLRLDRELGFRKAFQGPQIDPLLRLPDDASDDETYRRYLRSVKIGYDPTEGVINMNVIAPDPVTSRAFSLALIRYAEGKVDQMSARLREDQMRGAEESYRDAEYKVQDAQKRVQELQNSLGVLDPQAEGSMVMGRISSLETELTKKRLELGQLLSNATPNASRVAGVKGDISRIEEMIADTRKQLTENAENRNSLAEVTGEIKLAESELLTRQQLLAKSAEQLELARIEANKQVRYLSLSIAPVPPDTPSYPKAFEGTLVAFIILSGVYLMLSLTVSILREQVSS